MDGDGPARRGAWACRTSSLRLTELGWVTAGPQGPGTGVCDQPGRGGPGVPAAARLRARWSPGPLEIRLDAPRF